MPVSLFREVTFPCPRCSREVQARVALAVHADEHPDLVDAARQGDLHRVTCPACGHEMHLDAPLLLYFPQPPETWGLDDDGPVALFAPARGTTPEEDRQTLQALLEHLARALDQPVDTLAGRTLPVPPDALAAVLEQGPGALVGAGGRSPTPARAQGLAPLREILDAAGDLGRALATFLAAPTWSETRRVLETHPELLSDPGLIPAGAVAGRSPPAGRRRRGAVF